MSIIITDHAYERAKSRLSLNKKAFIRTVERAYESGIKHAETKSHLKKYIDKLFLSHKNANNIKIYGQIVYLFVNNVLITVYPIPSNLIKYLKL